MGGKQGEGGPIWRNMVRSVAREGGVRNVLRSREEGGGLA